MVLGSTKKPRPFIHGLDRPVPRFEFSELSSRNGLDVDFLALLAD